MRKEQMLNRLSTRVSYADNESQCRSVIIENYFGDKEAKPCGCCDICLAKKRLDRTSQITTRIVDILAQEPMLLRDIARKVTASQQSVGKALRELVDSGKVTISDSGLVALVPDRGSKS